ncbi:hypothetical protein VP01_619g2, partial [Puccinia sorghi]
RTSQIQLLIDVSSSAKLVISCPLGQKASKKQRLDDLQEEKGLKNYNLIAGKRLAAVNDNALSEDRKDFLRKARAGKEKIAIEAKKVKIEEEQLASKIEMNDLKLLNSYEKYSQGDDEELEVLCLMKKKMKEKWLQQ